MASDKKRDDIRRTTRIIQIDEMLRGGRGFCGHGRADF